MDDDWLKPQNDSHATNSVLGGISDLPFPDLQLPDLGRWWLDLEFLDLASGPPASYSSANQEKNKRNPTLGCNFPDIFFDSTSSSGLFGDDSHRFDRFVSETFKDHPLDFDLFPTASVAQTAEKLLDDLELVVQPQASSSTLAQTSDLTSESDIQISNEAKASTNHFDEDGMFILPQEFHKVANNVDISSDRHAKLSAFDVPQDSISGKGLKNLLNLSEEKNDLNEVLQIFSKNLPDLEQELVAAVEVERSGNEKSIEVHHSNNRSKRVLRIKRMRALPGMKNMPPEGTVARVTFQTDQKKNATTISIMSKDSDFPEQCITVNTSDMGRAKNMIKSLHLDQLPIFKRVFANVLPNSQQKTTAGKNQLNNICIATEVEEESIARQLGNPITKLYTSWSSNPEISSQAKSKMFPLWVCPECKLGFSSLTLIKDHLFGHKSSTFQDGSIFSVNHHGSILDQVVLSQVRFEFDKKEALELLSKSGIELPKLDFVLPHDNTATPLWLCPDCDKCFHDTKLLRDHLVAHRRSSQRSNGSTKENENSAMIDSQKKNLEAKIREFVIEMASHGITIDASNCVVLDGSKRSWRCPDCDKGFPKMSSLKQHVFKHRNIRLFVCQHPGCSKQFISAFKLKRHVSIVHSEQPVQFLCTMPSCENKKFSTIYTLNTHMKKHNNPEAFECNFCQKKFSTKNTRDKHYRIHQYLDEYACTKCPKKFASIDELASHAENHSQKIESLTCNFEGCGKVFKKPSLLKSHQTVHNGLRPFPCQFPACNWSFRTVSKLRRHEKYHKNQRNHVCQICQKAYLRTEHLKGHLRSAHFRERFSCAFQTCGATFSAKSTLCQHMQKHKERMLAQKSFFRCVLQACEEKFSDRKLLSEHVNQFHQSELGTVGLQQDSEQASLEELDLIALLSSVGDEVSTPLQESDVVFKDLSTFDLGIDKDILPISPSPHELLTVDTSAITPITFDHIPSNNLPTVEHQITEERNSQNEFWKRSAKKKPRISKKGVAGISLLRKSHPRTSRGDEVENVVTVPECYIGD